MSGPTIKYLKATPAQCGRLSLVIRGISKFMASAESIIESKKVEIGGVQWHTVAKSFVENGTTYLAYYLRGAKDGDWRRWLNAQICMLASMQGTRYVFKSLPNEMRTSSAEDAYAEWGCDKFISKEELLGAEGFVCHDFLYLRVDFSYGIDIFSEESEAHHTNMKLTVGGQPVFVNKDLLSLHSPVFERLFKERAGEKEITLQDNDLMGLLHFLWVIYPPHEKLNAATVKAVYRMAESYGVEYLLEQCEEHVLGSTEFSLVDKLALADELNNSRLFDRLMYSLDEQGLKALASNVDVNVQLRGKAVERHLLLLSDDRPIQTMPLNKVLLAQQTKDEQLMAYVIDNLTARDIAHLKRAEHKNKFTKETLIALFGKAQSLIP